GGACSVHLLSDLSNDQPDPQRLRQHSLRVDFDSLLQIVLAQRAGFELEEDEQGPFGEYQMNDPLIMTRRFLGIGIGVVGQAYASLLMPDDISIARRPGICKPPTGRLGERMAKRLSRKTASSR